MAYKVRGKRDGTGSYKHSYRRKVERKKKGRRKAKGVKCPYSVKKRKKKDIWSELKID